MIRLPPLLVCVLFYCLAAWATFRVHVSQRIIPITPSDYKGPHPVTGTNYQPWQRHFDPVVMTAGANGRGSATKLQILFFSLVVFGLVSYILMLTGI